MAAAATSREGIAGSVEDLLDRLNRAYSQSFPASYEAGEYYCTIVATYPDEGVCYAVRATKTGDYYFELSYEEGSEGIVFGDPQPAELRFLPANARESAGVALHEHRRAGVDVRPLSEAVYDAEAHTLGLTVIAEGFNWDKSRYYTESALRSGERMFSGLKQYLNHQTAAEERVRPEGDLRDWVASLGDVKYDAKKKVLRASAKIVDPAFNDKCALLDKQGLLTTMGVSIRAVGSGQDVTMEGVNTFRVDEFVIGKSVDFVTEPGAGGYVDFRESLSSGFIPGLSVIEASWPQVYVDILEAATRQLEEKAIPPHKTPTNTKDSWDAGAAVKDAGNDADVLRHMHAWVDSKGDPTQKASYKFPHHAPKQGSAANIRGVNNALARLSQANIPASEAAAVERHLRKHRSDAGLSESVGDHEHEEDLMSAEELAASLKRASDAEARAADLERQLSEESKARTAAEEKAAAATSALELAKEAATKEKAQVEITGLIEAAKLPEASKTYLKENLSGATDVASAKVVIEKHAEYLKSLKVSPVRDMGESAAPEGEDGEYKPGAAREAVRGLFGMAEAKS